MDRTRNSIMNKELAKKIEEWSLGKNNYKLIPPGGEILKYIGSEMLLIEFTKGEDGVWTSSKPYPVFIQRIGDYAPMTGTYMVTYSVTLDKSKTETLAITPEGFSFNNPDEEGWMKRFISYSLHFKTMEEELFYGRLKTKFDSSEGVLPPDVIAILQAGKQKESLGYHNYIAAVIDTDTPEGIHQGILSFRISEITKMDKRPKYWSFGIRDWGGYFMGIQKYQEHEGSWIAKDFKINGVILGDLKIMDIEDPKAL